MSVSRISTPAAFEDMTSGSPQTMSVDGQTGSNRYLVVAFYFEQNSSSDISAVTYNSVALTKLVDSLAPAATTTAEDLEIWGLVAPATGANTLSWEISDTGKDIAVQPIILQGTVGAVEAGANDKSALENTATTNVTLTTTVASSIILAFMSAETDTVGPFTPDSGTVEVIDDTVGTGSTGIAYFVGERIEATPGDYAVGATTTGASSPRDINLAAVDFREVSSQSPVPIIMQLM